VICWPHVSAKVECTPVVCDVCPAAIHGTGVGNSQCAIRMASDGETWKR
jgi:hypothetical protein